MDQNIGPSYSLWCKNLWNGKIYLQNFVELEGLLFCHMVPLLRHKGQGKEAKDTELNTAFFRTDIPLCTYQASFPPGWVVWQVDVLVFSWFSIFDYLCMYLVLVFGGVTEQNLITKNCYINPQMTLLCKLRPLLLREKRTDHLSYKFFHSSPPQMHADFALC